MRAITLHQPYAAAIAYGWKRIETRPWRPSEKILKECRPVAIHAGMGQLLAYALNVPAEVLQPPTTLPIGAIVAVADIRCVLPAATALERFGLLRYERDLGAYGPKRWGWVLSSIRRLSEPIFMGGRQGLWKVPDRYHDMIAEYARAGIGVNVG